MLSSQKDKAEPKRVMRNDQRLREEQGSTFLAQQRDWWSLRSSGRTECRGPRGCAELPRCFVALANPTAQRATTWLSGE